MKTCTVAFVPLIRVNIILYVTRLLAPAVFLRFMYHKILFARLFVFLTKATGARVFWPLSTIFSKLSKLLFKLMSLGQFKPNNNTHPPISNSLRNQIHVWPYPKWRIRKFCRYLGDLQCTALIMGESRLPFWRRTKKKKKKHCTGHWWPMNSLLCQPCP